MKLFRSLRNRLVLSHILPVILVVPLLVGMLVYVLETRLLLPMVYRDLAKDAHLMAEITSDQPIFWMDGRISQALVDGVTPYLSGRVSFITLDGHLLAASDMVENGSASQLVELPELNNVGRGDIVEIRRGAQAEVFAPVFDISGKAIGIIRVSTRIVTVSDELYQLRFLLGAILIISVVVGIILGSAFAVSINRPIQRITNSILAIAKGNWQSHVAEAGPDELRDLAQAVNTLIDRLNSLEKARRQLLANLVHELGRPLGAIRSAVQALLKGANNDPALSNEMLTGIDSETVRLQRLLEDLAGLHDQVLGSLELNRVSIQMDRWLVTTVSSWESAAVEKGLAWKVEIEPSLPEVSADPDRLGQALGNLLSNAIKFTPPGGLVTVAAKSLEGRLIISVADNGPGIPLDEQGKIFEPFYRGSHGRRIIQGMGLGLSIARDIITAHGGEIEVESDGNSGCRFTFFIPVLNP
ncbi:MAG: HAMP domain-containing histidine kinase [Anaerolineae bacterium]|nr:HAMP domain-containing histidine kinase [Anaerolineae bacterium]